jgi:hypothetical protein
VGKRGSVVTIPVYNTYGESKSLSVRKCPQFCGDDDIVIEITVPEYESLLEFSDGDLHYLYIPDKSRSVIVRGKDGEIKRYFIISNERKKV